MQAKQLLQQELPPELLQQRQHLGQQWKSWEARWPGNLQQRGQPT
jgi:hypothetical protein